MASTAAIEKLLTPDVPKSVGDFGHRYQQLAKGFSMYDDPTSIKDVATKSLDLADDLIDYKNEVDSRLYGAFEIFNDIADFFAGIFSFHLEDRREIEDWCDINLSGPFKVTTIERNYSIGLIFIRNDSDAVQYKLRWGAGV